MSVAMSDRRDLNVSLRLRRMIKASALPRVGKAHVLRMRYVDLTHILCIQQRLCTRGRIVSAMFQLLEGWDDTEEGHSDVGGYVGALSGTQRSGICPSAAAAPHND